MNDINRISRYVNSLIRRKPDVSDGVGRIKKTLHQSFRFYDVRLVNETRVREGCREFADWLSKLVISQPPPEGVIAVYFGIFKTEDGMQMYASGSKLWHADDPDWACRSDWRPEGRVLMPRVFEEITKVFSDFNLAGYYITVTYMILMILDFARHSMISLLDRERRSLYVACGFDDGELFNVGVLVEGDVLTIREARKLGVLPAGVY